ncbi:MAG: hypothetical protein LBU82_07670, partial [Treponema sp.]|nr:hypothetical protein [Treponema sp.]
MGTSNISEYMLELYNLNVVSPEERELIKTALASDAELRLRYEALERSDYEILQRYPVENMPTPAVLQDSDAPIRKTSLTRQGAFVKSQFSTKAKYRIVLGLTAAAAVLVCVFFISLVYLQNLNRRPTEIASVPNNETGWARGTENNIHDFSISLYPL